MKISDFIFRYRVGTRGRRDAMCRVRIFAGATGAVVALVTDLGEKNPGKSITNAIEWLHSALLERGFINNDAILIQHYEREMEIGPSFSLVTIDSDFEPAWSKITLSKAAKLMGCDKAELLQRTLDNERLANSVEAMRTRIDPFLDLPYEEAPDVINRRADIQRKMVRRGGLDQLIRAEAGERELQALLRSDLSLIAEAYAHPEEEYVAMSELPVGKGFVDFAVFSGRSRMDVTLIEVKGADFSIISTRGYRNFAAKFNEASKQIQSRLGYIYRNYEEFRTFAHQTRLQIELGNAKLTSLLGPFGELEVDPGKDIKVNYVVIAGRTMDDQAESRIRHDFEGSFNPRIRVESWDTWARKLRRP